MQNNFSSNMLKTFKECPQKYFLQYVENIQIPQNSKSAEKGKNIHALINYYFNGFDTSKLAGALSEEEKVLWQNFLDLNIKKEDVYKSEYTFNVKIDDSNWLTGRIDAIIKKNGKYIIYDWKTGTIPKDPDSDFQTSVYMYAVYEILKHKKLISNIEEISFNYTNLKKSENIDILGDKGKIDNSKNTLINTIADIHSYPGLQASKNKSGNTKVERNEQQKILCQKCKYKSIC